MPICHSRYQVRLFYLRWSSLYCYLCNRLLNWKRLNWGVWMWVWVRLNEWVWRWGYLNYLHLHPAHSLTSIKRELFPPKKLLKLWFFCSKFTKSQSIRYKTMSENSVLPISLSDHCFFVHIFIPLCRTWRALSINYMKGGCMIFIELHLLFPEKINWNGSWWG
jgi:hypothetical protein